jgi:hypothetical protein
MVFAFACGLLLGVARAQEAPSVAEQQRTGFFARTVVVGGVERRTEPVTPEVAAIRNAVALLEQLK